MSDSFPPGAPLPPERRAWRTDAEWQRLRERVDAAELNDAESGGARPRWGTRRQWLAAAAAIVFASISIPAVTRQVAKHAVSPAQVRTATTAAGERIVVHLADSSLITLGPASTIRYSVAAARRDVELVGLANFKVAHDNARPFIVHAKNAVMTDIGTEFVVRAYPSDSTVQVAVTSGSVALSGSDTSRTLQLRAGSLGRIGPNGPPTTSAGTASARAAWVDGRLVFDDQSLADVAAELSRWFDVDIRVSTAALSRRRVSAIYNSPSLAGVLDAVTATLDARYERNGRVVTIVPRSR